MKTGIRLENSSRSLKIPRKITGIIYDKFNLYIRT